MVAVHSRQGASLSVFSKQSEALTPWNLAGFLYHCKRQYISALEAELFFHGRSSDYYLQHTKDHSP